jgi:hypothetical protein
MWAGRINLFDEKVISFSLEDSLAKSSFDMRSYARRGAEARITELRDEMEAILGAFPELRQESPARRRKGPAGISAVSIAPGADGGVRTRKPRRPMTTAERKAVGERMKKYWAERKTQQTAKKR